MIDLVAFEVLGLPGSQGSKTKMPNGAMVEGGSKTGRERTKAWRTAVAQTARDVAGGEPYDGALHLTIEFRLPMPASRRKAIRELGRWPHSVKPDIDKLTRATLDGLTAGGLIVDDARVFALAVEAYEVTGWTGAEIVLRRFEA